MSIAHTSASILSIADGHYPSTEEIKGLPFDLKVVLYAIDIDEEKIFKRKEAMERIVKTWNSHDDLVKALQDIADDCADAAPPSYGAIRQAAMQALAKAGAA